MFVYEYSNTSCFMFFSYGVNNFEIILVIKKVCDLVCFVLFFSLAK